MAYLNWLWAPSLAGQAGPILFLLICVISLMSLLNFVGLLRFRRRLEKTDKEIASLHDDLLMLKIRMTGLIRRRKRKQEQKPTVLQFPDKTLGG
jgi:hypothetical protein